MSSRTAAGWTGIFAALALAGLLGLPGGPRPAGDAAPGGHATARVLRVVDGDTIEVALSGRAETVRYIGMDTPETVKPHTPVECFGKAASARNRRLVAGRRVELRFDAELRDRYGRLLAYVRRLPDHLFVNAALVRGGFAVPLTIAPNVAHAGLFLALARQARRAGRGLWRTCQKGT